MLLLENLIIYFIDSFLIIGAGLSFIGIRPKIKKIALLGAVYTLLINTVRTFYTINNIPLGTHTFVLVPCFIIVLKLFGKQSFKNSTIAVLISIFLTLWGEGIFFAIFRNVYINNLDKPGIMLLSSLLSHTVILIVFIITYFFKITIINFNTLKENDKK